MLGSYIPSLAAVVCGIKNWKLKMATVTVKLMQPRPLREKIDITFQILTHFITFEQMRSFREEFNSS
jgi:hypothetical protein